MKIVIPSMSRATTMTTHRLLKNFVVSVPQSQKADYLKVTPSVLTHPDSIKGLTPKLNHLLRLFADEDALVFLDDDLVGLRRCFLRPCAAVPTAIKDPDHIEAVIAHTAQLAADAGAFFFGWEPSDGALRYYSGLRPLMLTGYVNGCAMGFRRGHGLSFDERIVAKNDFDVSALNAYRHRIVLKNCRYCFMQRGTFHAPGGQAAFRTSGTEERDVALLRAKYGAETFPAGGFSGTRKRDYKGVAKITLHLPF